MLHNSVNTENLALHKRAESRSISPENPTGGKGMGAMDEEGVCSSHSRDFGKGWKISPCIYIEAGETAVLANIEGPGTIQTMWFTGSFSRDYILRIYWDGQETPSVQTPMTDFFGSGWYDCENKIEMEFAPIDSALISNNPVRGFNSYFTMPFQKHCKITLENIGIKKCQLYFQINYELAPVPEDALYFHASWKRVHAVPTGEEYVILDGVKGAGHYVGVMLNVGLNGPNLWWGEGELKFFLDGDKEYPTMCYTGTEDYFGGAWGWGDKPYNTLYMGVHFMHEAQGGEDYQTRLSMYRWHVLDPIRFEDEIKITIQDLGWRRNGKYYLGRNDDFSSVVYWYQTLPSIPFVGLPDRDFMEII